MRNSCEVNRVALERREKREERTVLVILKYINDLSFARMRTCD